MPAFLQHIAKEIQKNGDYHKQIVVLPNKRSAVFLKKALVEAEQKVILAPQIYSIQSFINHLAPYRIADSLELLFDFFLVYREKHHDKAQSFEEFIRWASPVLSDFDDIDAYDVNAKEVFTYISEVKKLEDWQLQPDSPKLISDYLQFYLSLYDLYSSLQQKLKKKNTAYQGMNSRWVAQHIDKIAGKFADNQIVFAGFNALTRTEEQIIKKLLEEKKARIYWDADEYYLKPGFEAGKFMLQNQKNFTDFKWIFKDFDQPKHIEIIGVPGKGAQAQVISQKLSEMISPDQEDAKAFLQTAIVLNEVELLLPLINALPEEMASVNITLGLPLTYLPVTSLFLQLLKLFFEREQYGRFHIDTLAGLIHQTYLEQILTEHEQEANRQLLQKLLQFKTKLISDKLWTGILQSSGSYLKRFFSGNFKVEALLLIFLDLIDYLSTKNLSDLDRLALVKLEKMLSYLQDFIRQTHEVKSIATFQFLFKQLLLQERLAFEGEPLEGLQIMGLLETRLLDFKHVIITSVNEGVLPKSKNERSIIPFELKKHFGLPMHYDKTAVTAYHFYRLLQRADKITLLYNTDTTGFGAAEPSRFIAQLKNEMNPSVHNIEEKLLVLPAETAPDIKQEIRKNAYVFEQLKKKAESGFSVSALSKYVSNPLLFYKKYILKLEEADELNEAIPANIMGTIIHNVMEDLYKKYEGKTLTTADFKPMLARYEKLCLHHFIKESFGEEIPVNENLIEGKNLIAFEIIKKNVKDILISDKKLVQQGKSLEIVSVEEKIKVPLKIKGHTINIVGYIDRVDRLDGVLRIVDYKTGSVDDKTYHTNHMEDLIRHPKKSKVFQLLTYAWIYKEAGKLNPGDFPIQTGIISTRQIKKSLLVPKVFKSDKITAEILDEFEKYLVLLLEEIFDKNVPFVETDNPY